MKDRWNDKGRRLYCFFIVALLALLIAGCDPVESIAVGMKNAESYALDGRYLVRGRYPVDLGRFAKDIPKKTVIAHVNLEKPHSVYLEYEDDDRTEFVGELQYLTPDTPVKVMLFSIGEEYHMIGWIDHGVEGAIDMLTFFSGNATTSIKHAGTNPASRIFSFPIYPEDEWSDIDQLRIHTIESMSNNSIGKEPSVAWEMEFSPSLSFEEMKEAAIQMTQP